MIRPHYFFPTRTTKIKLELFGFHDLLVKQSPHKFTVSELKLYGKFILS